MRPLGLGAGAGGTWCGSWPRPRQLCSLGELLCPRCPGHTSRAHLVMSRGQPMAVSKEVVEGTAKWREGTSQDRAHLLGRLSRSRELNVG